MSGKIRREEKRIYILIEVIFGIIEGVHIKVKILNFNDGFVNNVDFERKIMDSNNFILLF